MKKITDGSLNIKAKVWLEKNGEPVFGIGRLQLLKKIDSTGSISKAARELGFSYKKAWSYINIMEKRFGYPLIEKKIGGKSGGGSVLTENAKKIMTNYENLIKKEGEFIKNFEFK